MHREMRSGFLFRRMMAGVALAICGVAFAKTNYVDKSMSDYTGHDGSTPEKAYRRIQDAIKNAANGDTILVAPGVYGDDQGLGRTGKAINPDSGHWWGSARLLIAYKSLHLKSTHGAANTFIVGAHDTNTVSGLGDYAVRCICIEADGNYTNVVEGFTLCDGATRDLDSGSGEGGALMVSTDGTSPLKNTAFFVDCVITNCIAARSAIAFGGTLMRCRVQDNAFVTSTAGNTHFLSRGTYFFSTLFFRNWMMDPATRTLTTKSIFLANGGRFVNCTFAHNASKFYSHNYNDFYNSVFSDTAVGSGDGARHNVCITDSTTVRGLIAPVFGDVRVRAGSSLIGVGDAAYAADETIIPFQTLFPVERMKDLYGQDIPATGTICPGCAQTVATPAAGAIIAYDKDTYFGTDTLAQSAASYLHPTNYPVSYRLHGNGATRPDSAIVTLSGMALKQSQSTVRFPSWTDDSLEVIPPPSVDGVLKVKFVAATAVKYADANTEEETALQDGSEEHPFKTLQQAVDSIDSRGVIIAKPGVYDAGAGERTFSGDGVTVKARAYFGSKFIRLVSSDGPEVTTIVGAPDPSSADGCGQGVTLIAAIDGTAGIQGFTLTGGYSTKGGVWASGRGSIYSYGTDLHVTDCVITNNVGYNYALGTARFERCLISGNTGRIGIAMGAKMISCVLAHNTVENADGVLYGETSTYAAYLLNCSVLGDGTHAVWNGALSDSLRVNTVVDEAAGALPTAGSCFGCVFDGFSSYSGGTGFVAADPCFGSTEASGFDLRVFSRSPAVTAGTPGSAFADSDWWYFCTSDYNGNPWRFDAEGRVVAGALQETFSGGVYVVPGAGLAVASGGQNGFNAFAGDAARNLTLAFTSGSSRPLNGIVVNGETNLFTEASQSTTFAFSAATTGDALVVPLYGNSWYVRPGEASDPAAAGYNATCAFGTLKQALSNPALAAGDTVVALPGVYEAETMDVAGKVVKARAVVPNNVTLTAQGGWTNTFIKGAPCDMDTDHSNTAAYDASIDGMGKSAVRGVYLGGSGSVVRGFTITNCYVRGAKDDGTGIHNDADGCGAGVAGSGRAERCRFVDCHAFRGGGAYLSKAVDCLFERNFALYGGGASDNAYHYGCLSRENQAVSSQRGNGFFYWSACENCTVQDSIGGPKNGTVLMKNTLVLSNMCDGDVNDEALSSGLFSHCAFANDVNGTQTGRFRPYIGTGNLLVPSTSLEIDGDGRPVIGRNVAVDAGDAALNSTYIGATDLFDGQRVYNAVQDIGALEGDWRATYAKAIKQTLFSVQTASPGVVTNVQGRVTLSDGAALEGILLPRTRPVASALDVQVTDGTLTVSIDGVETVYAGNARVMIPGSSFASNLSFAYAGTGSAVIGEILKAKEDGTVIVFR